MSHRVWEGIRRDEYTFTELPATVREKEAKQAYKMLRESSIQPDNSARIPEKDRTDFIRAYEGGHHEEAEKILERRSFRENMYRDADSKMVRHSSVDLGSKAQKDVTVARVAASGPPEKVPLKPEKGSMESLDLSSINLGAVRLPENPSEGAVANLPQQKGGAAREC